MTMDYFTYYDLSRGDDLPTAWGFGDEELRNILTDYAETARDHSIINRWTQLIDQEFPNDLSSSAWINDEDDYEDCEELVEIVFWFMKEEDISPNKIYQFNSQTTQNIINILDDINPDTLFWCREKNVIDNITKEIVFDRIDKFLSARGF